MENTEKEKIFYKWDLQNKIIRDKRYIKPFINCPWKPIQNPNELDEQEHYEWLKSTKLFKDLNELDEFFKGNTRYMSSYINPFNPVDNIKWVIRLHEFIYIVDDLYFEKGLLGEEWVKNLFNKYSPQDNTGKVFWEIIDGIEQTGNKQAVEKLIQDTKIWALSVFSLNKSKLNSGSSFEYYSKYRCVDVGMDFGLATANIHVPPFEKKYTGHPIYVSALYKYNQIHSLINDIASLPRENKDDRIANYVMVHSFQSGSIPESLLYCKSLVELIMIEMGDLCDELVRLYPDSDQVAFHTNLLKVVVSGDNHVSNDTNYTRYTSDKM